MTNKPTRQELEQDNKELRELCLMLGIFAFGFLIGLFIVAFVTGSQNNNLQSQITELKQNCNLIQNYTLNVICKGDGVYSSGNFTFNDYILYQKMLKIFDVPQCEVLPQ